MVSFRVSVPITLQAMGFMEAERDGIIKVHRVVNVVQNFGKLAAGRIDLMISQERIACPTEHLPILQESTSPPCLPGFGETPQKIHS